jgi:hypothetical protein
MKHIIIGISLAIASLSSANALTFLISGKLNFQNAYAAAPQLLALDGQSFTATLTYNPDTAPTSVWAPNFHNYANEGSLYVITPLGNVSSNLDLQTFMLGGAPSNGSNFTGFGRVTTSTGTLAQNGLTPLNMDFSFQSSQYSTSSGLSSFALPSEITLNAFDGAAFIRLNFSSLSNPNETARLLGAISSISAVPEPSVWALAISATAPLIAGIALGRRTRKEQVQKP